MGHRGSLTGQHSLFGELQAARDPVSKSKDSTCGTVRDPLVG